MKMANSINLLISTPHYITFIKDQVEALSSHVEGIEVSITYNPLVEVSNILPIGGKFTYFRKYTKKNLADFINVPNNVKISFIPTIYVVPDGSNKAIGDKIFKNTVQWIEDKKIKNDLIHAHFTWPCGYVGVKLANKYCVPLVVTAHGFDVYELPFRDQFWFNRVNYVLDNTSHIITVSQKMRNIIVRKLGISDNKVSVIPNGFDSRLFCLRDKIRVRQNMDLPLNKKIILNVANLIPVKGHSYLIEAMSKIVEERKDILCVIIGEDVLRKDLEKQIKKLNLENYVELVGAKPHNEIPLWMNAADFFVMSSLNEGNPTVMFEALGCGKPFIGTKVGGVPEIIINDKLGILVEPKDSVGLAKAIQRALETEWDEKYIREYAEQFMWGNISRQIMDVYESVMKNEVN